MITLQGNSAIQDTQLRRVVGFLFLAALLAYGIAGVLGFALFSLAVIIAVTSVVWCRPRFYPISLLVYAMLSGMYWVLLVRTSFSDSFLDAFLAMGPLAPLAILPLFLFIFPPQDYAISAVKIGRVAMSSILIVVVFILAAYFSNGSLKLPALGGRYEGFHGNAVPFSLVMLSLGCLSLAGWRSQTTLYKLLGPVAYITAIYMVAVLSQVRGVTMGAVFTTLIFIVFSMNWLRLKPLFLFTVLLLATVFISVRSGWIYDIPLPERAAQSFSYLKDGKLSSSDSQRFEMWRLGMDAITDEPLVGYGYLQRFDAVKEYGASQSVLHFKHLHNDLITVSVAGGLLGFIGGIAILFAPIAVWWLYRRGMQGALPLSVTLAVAIASASLSNTVLFNDVMPSWIVFACLLLAYYDSE